MHTFAGKWRVLHIKCFSHWKSLQLIQDEMTLLESISGKDSLEPHWVCDLETEVGK